MSNKPVWNLTFQLTEYTPAEVEKMTGLSVTMQRDWRHRGFGPQFEKHARFDIIQVAELLFMKVFSDQGKGPALSNPYSRRVAFALIKNCLTYRHGSWLGDPIAAFDAIPRECRFLTEAEERYGEPEHDAMAKNRWLAENLLNEVSSGSQRISSLSNVIWWPTGELEIADYEIVGSAGVDGDKTGYVDPKFEGPALIWQLDAAATLLAKRAPRPFVAVSVAVNDAPDPASVVSNINRGEIKILRGKNDVGGKK